MNREEQLGTEQTQNESFLSGIVNVISGARQSANQEFNRFWKTVMPFGNIPHYLPNHANTYIIKPAAIENTLVSASIKSKSELDRIRAGEIIHGRIIPDINRCNFLKHTEIQTDDIITAEKPVLQNKKSTTLQRDNTEEFDLSTFPLKKRARLISRASNSSNEFDQEMQSRPTKIFKHDLSLPSTTLLPSDLSLPASPQPPTLISENKPQLSFSITSNDTSFAKNRTDIQTGKKSVRRLTFELEESFSPKLPPAFTRKPSASYENGKEIATFSTPSRKRPLELELTRKNSLTGPLSPGYLKINPQNLLSEEDSASNYLKKINGQWLKKSLNGDVSNRHVQNNNSKDLPNKDLVIAASLTGHFSSDSSNHFLKKTSMDRVPFTGNIQNDSLLQKRDTMTEESMESNYAQNNNHTPKKRILTEETSDGPLEKYDPVKETSRWGTRVIELPVTSEELIKTRLKILRSPRRDDSTNKFKLSPKKYKLEKEPPLKSPTQKEMFGKPKWAVEEDERMEALEQKIMSIHDQMKMVYPSIINSPKPSHTIRKNTPLPISTAATTAVPLPSPPITLSPTRDIATTHVSPKRNDYRTSPPRKYSISHNSYTTPEREPFNKNTYASPIRHTPVRSFKMHKSQMQELVKQIPKVELRKTDKLIDANGNSYPNPFWLEIYNSKRKY